MGEWMRTQPGVRPEQASKGEGECMLLWRLKGLIRLPVLDWEGDGAGLTSQPSLFPCLEEGRLVQVITTLFLASTFSRQGEEVG